jgi:hypothetical protein
VMGDRTFTGTVSNAMNKSTTMELINTSPRPLFRRM